MATVLLNGARVRYRHTAVPSKTAATPVRHARAAPSEAARRLRPAKGLLIALAAGSGLWFAILNGLGIL